LPEGGNNGSGLKGAGSTDSGLKGLNDVGNGTIELKTLPASTGSTPFGANVSHPTLASGGTDKWTQNVNGKSAIGQAIKLNNGKLPPPPNTPNSSISPGYAEKAYGETPKGAAMNQKLNEAQKKYDALNTRLNTIYPKVKNKTATDDDMKQYNQIVNVDMPKAKGERDIITAQKKEAIIHFSQSLQIGSNTGAGASQTPAK
jgi:hypothetical protein